MQSREEEKSLKGREFGFFFNFLIRLNDATNTT